jgi:hypothetical protein
MVQGFVGNFGVLGGEAKRKAEDFDKAEWR